MIDRAVRSANTLEVGRSATSSVNDEPQPELEAPAVLLPASHPHLLGLRRLPSTFRPAAGNQGRAGAVCASRGEEESVLRGTAPEHKPSPWVYPNSRRRVRGRDWRSGTGEFAHMLFQSGSLRRGQVGCPTSGVAQASRELNAVLPNPSLERRPHEAGRPWAAQGSRKLHCPTRPKGTPPRGSPQLER